MSAFEFWKGLQRQSHMFTAIKAMQKEQASQICTSSCTHAVPPLADLELEGPLPNQIYNEFRIQDFYLPLILRHLKNALQVHRFKAIVGCSYPGWG